MMHEQFLLAALEQAKLGRGMCAPNPSVGAVAVQNGRIIAQSYHQGAGLAHAEVSLMRQFPSNTPGVTVYVTLEPCNHWGKTPPCVDAIIKHGISRVVYAYTDPNPVVSANDTTSLLDAHGIEVIHYPLPETNRFYQSYHYWCLTHMPWVTVKMAQTLDGKIAGKHGERVELSNVLCAEFTHQQRKACDIILTTAKTVNQDDPLLNVRLAGSELKKPVAIIDRTRTINPLAKIWTSASACRIYHDGKDAVTSAPKNCSWQAISSTGLNESFLNLSDILRDLGRLGYHDVWVEAGATLFNALHEENLVHRTHLYLVPRILGEEAMSLYWSNNVFQRSHSLRWNDMGDNMMMTLDWVPPFY